MAVFSRILILAAAVSAAACSWNKQTAAPVETGGAVYTPPTIENPYGAEPYVPAGEQVSTVYTPPAVSTTGYPAVDTSAATHYVVSGDTVYNISKRYGISQDDLRAWNGLNGNNINVGQTLRVKPVGYVPSSSAAVSAPSTGVILHTVVSGDTVYNISKRYGISQDDLRAWNNLNGNNINVGQTLRVQSNVPAVAVNANENVASNVAAPAAVAPSVQTTPVQTTAATAPSTTVKAGQTSTVSGITWQTPTAGKIITHFGGSSKGVDIAGTRGQDVYAAADGEVVYSGSGLRGYGNLLVIQHNKTYLTAYGNNDSLLVREGQKVRRGQVIAKMGSSDSDTVKLHFEVRENGTPVNPTRFVKF